MTKKKSGAKRAATMGISDLKRQKKAQEDKKLKKQNKKSEKLREEKEKLSEKEREKEFEAKLAEQKRHLGAEHQRKLAELQAQHKKQLAQQQEKSNATLAKKEEEHKTQLAAALAKKEEMYLEAAKHQKKLAKIGGELEALKITLRNQADKLAKYKEKIKEARKEQQQKHLDAKHHKKLAKTEGALDALGVTLEEQAKELAKYKEKLEKARAKQQEKHLDTKHQNKLAKTEGKLDALGAELEKQALKVAKYKTKLEKAREEQDEEAREAEDAAEVVKNLKVLGKNDINKFLAVLMKVDLSKKILCDITCDEFGKLSFTTVGRPDTSGSSTHQLEHIIPYSFVQKSINLLVNSSNDLHKTFIRLSKFALIFTQSLKKGLALSPDDHIKTRENPGSFSYGSLKENGNEIWLASPRHENKVTPRTKDRGKKLFSYVNYKFIKNGLEQLYTDIKNQQGDIFASASEALARFIFILFNSGEHVSFSKIGNSPREEIRLYKSKADAEQKDNKNYEIVSAEELLEKANHSENLNERIRLSKCEGNYVKKAHEALKVLNDIIYNYSKNATFAKQSANKYNQNYNIKLKLSNNKLNLESYNAELSEKNYTSIVYKHVAKILYSSFDLKGLPKIVLTPSSNFNGKSKYKIKIFSSTKATAAVDYAINLNAEEQRTQEIQKAQCRKNIFRNKEVDKKILATKIVELYFIGTYPFSELINKETEIKATKKWQSPILEALVTIAIADHDLKLGDAKHFQQEVSDLYELLKSSDGAEQGSEEHGCGSNLLGLFNEEDRPLS